MLKVSDWPAATCSVVELCLLLSDLLLFPSAPLPLGVLTNALGSKGLKITIVTILIKGQIPSSR